MVKVKKRQFLVLVISSVIVASLLQPALVAGQPDKHMPVPATDVEIVRKATLRGRAGGGKPAAPAATGTLGPLSTGVKYAIIVGISDYPGTTNDLLYADDDAMDLYNALTSLYGYDGVNIHLLIDTAATRSAIMNAIDNLRLKVLAGDEVVFFFSGHGARGKAADGDKEEIDEAIVCHEAGKLSYIWDGELRNAFSEFATTRIVFIFDSCLAGGMTDLKATGRIVSMATTETGVAYEGDAWQNGQFTYYFVDLGMLQGLADKYDHDGDGVKSEGNDVVVEEAFDYAKANCVHQKTPTISDSFTNDLLL